MPQSWIKLLMPLIIAIISLAGTIFVAIMQTTNASSAQVDGIVQEINTVILPAIQTRLDTQEDELDKLREEAAYWRGAVQRKLDIKETRLGTGNIFTDLKTIKDSLEPKEKAARGTLLNIPKLSSTKGAL